MAKPLLVFSFGIVDRGLREGDISVPSLHASFFAFYLQKSAVFLLLSPELISIVERAEREGRVHWRDRQYEVKDHDWIREVVRMIEANGVEVEYPASSDFEWTRRLLEKAVVKAGVEMIW